MQGDAIQTFSDPYEYQLFTPNEQRRIVVTASGRYEAEAARISLNHILIERGWQSLPTISFSAIRKGRTTISFQLDVAQAAAILEASNGNLTRSSFVRPAASIIYALQQICDGVHLSLPEDDLAAVAQAMTGRDLKARQRAYLMRPSLPSMSRLLSLHKAANHLAAYAPAVLVHPEVAKAIDQEIMYAVNSCLTAPDADEHGSPRNDSVMRRLEQMIDAHPNKPIYVAEVCVAIGVTDRTLRAYCRDHLGMGPHRFLWLRRMHQARRALALADRTAKTVTEIANDYGFGELGRFSVAYRKLFGEAPSMTLRRPYDTKSMSHHYGKK